MKNFASGKIVKKPYLWLKDMVFGRMRITVKSGDRRYEKSKPFEQKIKR